MAMKIGDRICAVAWREGRKVQIFGYGRMTAGQVPPLGIGVPRTGVDYHLKQIRTTKLELDNGSVAWGCECAALMEEADALREFADLDVETIDIVAWRSSPKDQQSLGEITQLQIQNFPPALLDAIRQMIEAGVNGLPLQVEKTPPGSQVAAIFRIVPLWQLPARTISILLRLGFVKDDEGYRWVGTRGSA